MEVVLRPAFGAQTEHDARYDDAADQIEEEAWIRLETERAGHDAEERCRQVADVGHDLKVSSQRSAPPSERENAPGRCAGRWTERRD